LAASASPAAMIGLLKEVISKEAKIIMIFSFSISKKFSEIIRYKLRIRNPLMMQNLKEKIYF